MNSLEEWTKLIAAVGVTLGVIGGGIKYLVGKFPPRAAGAVAEVARMGAEVARMSAEMGEVRADMRLLTDYVHDLREDFARETGKAPKDWPAGLRL